MSRSLLKNIELQGNDVVLPGTTECPFPHHYRVMRTYTYTGKHVHGRQAVLPTAGPTDDSALSQKATVRAHRAAHDGAKPEPPQHVVCLQCVHSRLTPQTDLIAG